MNNQAKTGFFFLFAIATSLFLPILTYAILIWFSIYGYRTLPIAWAFACIISILVAYFFSLVLLRRSTKQSWCSILINILLIVPIATLLGYGYGWHLGVPNAHDIYQSLYEGWIAPENTLTGAVYGAVVGFTLGGVATGWWQLYSSVPHPNPIILGAGVISTITTLGVCLSIMTTASQIVRVPYLIAIALTGVVFTLVAVGCSKRCDGLRDR